VNVAFRSCSCQPLGSSRHHSAGVDKNASVDGEAAEVLIEDLNEA
jgi:hypothetical protein